MIDRYSLSPLKEIWSDEYKFEKMLEIEIAICEAWSRKGLIPKQDLENIKSKAKIDLRDIREKEETSRHETVAFVESVASKIGKSGKYLHFGVTSSDILDTGQAMQVRDSLKEILKNTKNFKNILSKKAKEYKNLLIMGRTHGMHAEPITLGFKFLVWSYEIERDISRIERALESISYGKVSGSVGIYTHLDPDIEEYVCKKLKLKPSKASTQILQRDRYCDVIYSVTILGNTLEKIATEIRHLHRTEVNEVKEAFAQGQKGSSSMPHKKNPIVCERICGQSRVLRGNLMVAMENTNLWHERDMSHSSAERIIVPDSLCLIHFMLNDMSFIIKDLVVNKEDIEKNLHIEKDKIYSQNLMLHLVEKGMDKQEAYNLIQDFSFKKGEDFLNSLKENSVIKKYLSSEEIENLCTLSYYTRNIDVIFRRFNID